MMAVNLAHFLGFLCSFFFLVLAFGRSSRPAHLDAARVRTAALFATHLNTNAGSSGSVKLWHEECHDASCEKYSVGDGFCLMRASDRKLLQKSGLIRGDDVSRAEAGALLTVVSSNCRVRGIGTEAAKVGRADAGSRDKTHRHIDFENDDSMGNGDVKVQLFHCPKEVPIALLTVPKSGTTSTINWAMRMEGEDDLVPLRNAARLFMDNPGPQQFITDFLHPEVQKLADAGAIPPDKMQDGGLELGDRLVYRAIHRYKFNKPGQTKVAEVDLAVREFIPPAHLCPTCCLYGHGRQKVILARNPFVRITSYFRYSWLNYDRDYGRNHPWTSWQGFPNWIRAVVEVRRRRPGGFANDLSWVEMTPQVCSPLKGNATDVGWSCDGEGFRIHVDEVFHIRPISDMVRDLRFAAGPES